MAGLQNQETYCCCCVLSTPLCTQRVGKKSKNFKIMGFKEDEKAKKNFIRMVLFVYVYYEKERTREERIRTEV